VKEQDMSSLFDSVMTDDTTERPAYRQAPPGDYLAMVRAAKRVVANTGTEGLELQLTLVDVLNTDGDMDGVELAKARVRNTIWVTENNVQISRDTILRIMPSLRGTPWGFATIVDELPGAEVVVRLKHITHDRRTGDELRTPRLEVDKFFSVDWYNEKNRAA
jgi:hypothetical protein